MPNRRPVLVFDIGGTKVACAVWTPEGNLVARTEIDTQAAAGPDAVAGRVVELGRRVLARVADEQSGLGAPSAAGVASAGQIDVATGTVSYATFHLPGWIGFPLGQRLSAGLGMPVTVDNDVNCHALAEARLGAGRSYRHFLLAAVGTGVGGGVVIDGQVYHGRRGGAGEIGQLCVEPHDGRPCSGDLAGCLELYAASSVMVAESGYASVHDLAEVYRVGTAVPAVEQAAAWLGKGLAMIAHVLAPEAILIGGSAGLLGPRYLAAVQVALDHFSLPSHHGISLHFAELGADSGLIGAGLLAGTLKTSTM